jgi:hypothetical protein
VALKWNFVEGVRESEERRLPGRDRESGLPERAFDSNLLMQRSDRLRQAHASSGTLAVKYSSITLCILLECCSLKSVLMVWDVTLAVWLLYVLKGPPNSPTQHLPRPSSTPLYCFLSHIVSVL